MRTRFRILFLSGKRQEAVAAVPDALVDELSLVGPKERILERAAAWKASKATTLLPGRRFERNQSGSRSFSLEVKARDPLGYATTEERDD